VRPPSNDNLLEEYDLRFTTWIMAVTLAAIVAMPAAAQYIDDAVNPETADTLGQLRDEAAPAGDDGIARQGGDDFKSPKAAERFERRQEALRQKLKGQASNGKVHEVAKGQFVELALERTDRIFVILVEFGNNVSTNPAVPTYQGPLHNSIAEPNRALDNSTIWQADYNRDHYRDMYFNRMKEYYRVQSSGRYTFNGDVTEWVKVPFNGARYGNNSLGDPAMWTLIADAINVWTNNQLASGKTLDEVKAYLATFDQWDRYDYDHDGNFDESDGYIDHFQIVHSGAGEETGGGAQGANAIWSHRWAAWYNRGNVDGPAFNKDGGVEFGGGWGANPNGSTTGSTGAAISSANPTTAATVTYAHPVNRTGIWVGDYTVQPENGGLGVFAHEYGHDLGLPDHYDTSGGGSNGTGYWTVMSSGSYLGNGQTDIGQGPGDFYAWDKLQLGWLTYDIAQHGAFSTHKLGPAEATTKAAQAVVVSLPPSANTFHLYDPTAGSLAYGANAYWGGRGDNLDNHMVREMTVPAAGGVLQMRLNYAIEANWDYAYVSVSNNGGATWTNLAGTWPGGTNGAAVALTTNTNANGQNLGNGITGTTAGAWRLASFNLNAYAGQTVLVRVRYKTDPFTYLSGMLVDEITLGTMVDGAESDAGWTFNGFKATSGVEASNAPHYYIAEFRQYRTYDKGLQTGPYTFGRADRPKWVDHYAYQDGLLITYWDTAEANNNTSAHKGEGRSLVIDSHPEPLLRDVQYPDQAPFTSPWGSAVQSHDATFGLQATDALTLPFIGRPTTTSPYIQFFQTHASQPGVSVFDDRNSYWHSRIPTSSVIVPKTGTTIRVVSTSAQDTFMHVHVSPAN
jgi:immune inhibitor A